MMAHTWLSLLPVSTTYNISCLIRWAEMGTHLLGNPFTFIATSCPVLLARPRRTTENPDPIEAAEQLTFASHVSAK